MKNLPHLAFTYWSGDTLTPLHILTLKSLILHNEDLEVIVYTTSKDISSNHRSFELGYDEHKEYVTGTLPFSELHSISGIKVIEIDFEALYGIRGALFPTYLADITRIKKLEEHGGIWFDMDILFLKPFQDEMLTFTESKSLKTVSYSNTIATGFCIALPNSSLMKEMSRRLDQIILESTYTEKYQSLGPDLWRDVIGRSYMNSSLHLHPEIEAIDYKVIYPFLYTELDKLYSTEFSDERINKETLGIHWYNGASLTRKYLNSRYQDFRKEREQLSPFGKALCIVEDLEKKKALIINESVQGSKLSIAIAYYNRLPLLNNTLRQLDNFNFKGEIVIADDFSSEGQEAHLLLERFPQLDIHIVTPKQNHFNPSNAYNTAFAACTGDVIIIQNAESLWTQDISEIAKSIQDKEYIVFGCLGATKEETQYLHESQDLQNDVNSVQGFHSNSQFWYQHSEYKPNNYHYCTAILKKDLDSYLGGGFDKRFYDGYAADDDELIYRIVYENFKIRAIDYPYVIAQFHYKQRNYISPSKLSVLHEKNCSLLKDTKSTYGTVNYKGILPIPLTS